MGFLMINQKFQSFGLIVGMVLLASSCASTGSSGSKSTENHIKSGIYNCHEMGENLKVQKINNQIVKIMAEDGSDATEFHFDKQLGKFKAFIKNKRGTEGHVYVVKFLPNQIQMSSSHHNQTITCQFKQAK